MDMELYVVELRLAELRERAERYRVLEAVRAARFPLRLKLGQALIRLGRQLVADSMGPLSAVRTTGGPRERY
jgi:hypothetical protein